jgi:hypothetical protein
MSAANVQFTLPPGDRDDAIAPEVPQAPSERERSRDAVAGRKPDIPTLVLMRAVMRDRAEVFADLERAVRCGDWPLAEAAALRFRAACLQDTHLLAVQLQKEVQRHRRALATSSEPAEA